MFGIRFAKFEPSDFIMTFSNGKLTKKGRGLSFYYYAPTTSIVKVPLSSMEAPFVFEELTSDFQTVSVQGQVAYRIIEQEKIAEILNYNLDAKGTNYVSDDPRKLSAKVINTIKVEVKKSIESYNLHEVVRASEALSKKVLEAIRLRNEITLLGIEIIGLSILAIQPNKETARALEASAREDILKKADEAIYERRNASILQERTVKENEYNTELAIENKKRQVQETQMETERISQEKQNQMIEEQLIFDTELEEKRKRLIEISTENARDEADASAYALTVVMKALEEVEPQVLTTLARMEMKPEKLMALAFGEMAENAEKIGQLTITPDLLKEVINRGD